MVSATFSKCDSLRVATQFSSPNTSPRSRGARSPPTGASQVVAAGEGFFCYFFAGGKSAFSCFTVSACAASSAKFFSSTESFSKS